VGHSGLPAYESVSGAGFGGEVEDFVPRVPGTNHPSSSTYAVSSPFRHAACRKRRDGRCLSLRGRRRSRPLAGQYFSPFTIRVKSGAPSDQTASICLMYAWS
jgi:hypothetical protein